MNPISDGAEAADGVIDFVKSISDALKSGQEYLGGRSLIEVGRHARVEPLMIVDESAQMLQYVDDVAQTMQTLFAGYYLQAIEMITNIQGIKIKERLAPLNPNRKVDIDLLSLRLSEESYTFALPKGSNKNRIVRLSKEDDGEDKEDFKGKLGFPDKDMVKNSQEISSLSVGKQYRIHIKEGQEAAEILVGIRVIARNVSTDPLVKMFTHKNYLDSDLMERFHGWRSGRLRFVRDLILCQDLIEKHRNAAIKDKSGVYDEIITRKNSNVAAGLLERNPSLAVMSNLAIISADTLERIETEMGAPISSVKVKNTLFDTTNLMILAVMDPAYERVSFYMHGIAGHTELPMAKLKSSNSKGNGSEVLDVMKAFMTGKTPSL